MKKHRKGALLIVWALAILSGFLIYGLKANKVSVDLSGPFIHSTDANLLFVGDIMLSRNIGKLMVKHNDWSFPFALIKDTLRGADLTFANFENPVSTGGVLSGSIYSFRVDPRALEGVTDAGIDVVSFANNHVWDYGKVAFNDSLVLLNEKGISPVGAGATFADAHAPVIKEVNGVKIAFLAYTRLLPYFLGEADAEPAVAYPEPEQIGRDIIEAKKGADIVVVSFHWGDEYQIHHNAEQETLAHDAIDAGADLVIGHHPHVVQEVEKYNGKYIAYSLGNFIFDQNFSEDTHRGLMLKVHITDKQIASVEEIPVKFTKEYQPYIEQHEDH